MSLSNQLQIDGLHCRAICEEIGERLQIMLRPDAAELPARLQVLLDRRVEHGPHPVAHLQHRVGPGHEPGSLPQHRDPQREIERERRRLKKAAV